MGEALWAETGTRAIPETTVVIGVAGELVWGCPGGDRTVLKGQLGDFRTARNRER